MCAKTLQQEFDDSDRAAIEAAYQDMLGSGCAVGGGSGAGGSRLPCSE